MRHNFIWGIADDVLATRTEDTEPVELLENF
jgi:hypothetical protein